MIDKSKKHLDSANESYRDHNKVANKVGLKMIIEGLMAYNPWINTIKI